MNVFSPFSTVASAISGVAHGASNLAGDVLPFDVTPGFNLSTGSNGLSPTIAATGTTTPLGASHSTTTGQPAGSNNTTSTSSNNLSAGSGTTSGGTSSSSMANALNQYYDTILNNYQAQLGSLTPQLQAAQANVLNQYQNSYNPLARDYALGQSNLATSQNQVNKAQAQSLQQIADQVRQQMSSYNNMLGAYGAGNSSAADLIKFALGNSASANRYNVQQNAGQQTLAINNQQTALQNQYNDALNNLNTWKQQNLSDLATQYASSQAQINQQMASASAERQAQLAQIGAATQQQYLDQLAKLEGQVNTSAQHLNNVFANALAPQNVNIPSNLTQYQVQPISAGTLSQLSLPQNANSSSDYALALLNQLKSQTQPLIGS